jgi:phosphatidylglycerol:prolipoprotein diacylglycerol transferase
MIAYVLFSLTGVLAGACVSKLLALPKPSAAKRTEIYIAAAAGVLIGAKIPVWISYGFGSGLSFSGKSYLGGILGAFVALNIYKRFTRQADAALGGRFAIPLAAAAGFGKIGCFFNGCCAGRNGIPVQLMESAFQFAMAGVLYLVYRRTARIDILFPIYLASYLAMRFCVEFLRTEPRLWLSLTIYQWLAIVFLPYVSWILLQRRARNV